MKKILDKIIELIDNDILSKKDFIAKMAVMDLKNLRQDEIDLGYDLYNLTIYRQIFAYKGEKELWGFVKDFDKIIQLMDHYKFNEKDKFAVMIYLVSNNIAANYLEGANNAILLSNIHNISMKPFAKEKLVEWSIDGTLSERMFKLLELIDDEGYFIEDDSLLEEEKNVMNEIYVHLPELTEVPAYIKQHIQAHKAIKEHYLDKKDSYELDDIVQVTKAFLYLGISKQSCEAFHHLMKKDLEKRKKNVSQRISIIPVIKTSEKPNVITKKQYKTLLSKLRKFINMESKIVTHTLSSEEIIECTSIMLQLGLSEAEIKSYIKIMDKSQETNPITWYLNNYEKLKFHCNGDDVQNHLTNLESYFRETFICNDEDYILWKESIQEELDKLKLMIPKNYQYELTVANKRTK